MGTVYAIIKIVFNQLEPLETYIGWNGDPAAAQKICDEYMAAREVKIEIDGKEYPYFKIQELELLNPTPFHKTFEAYDQSRQTSN